MGVGIALLGSYNCSATEEAWRFSISCFLCWYGEIKQRCKSRKIGIWKGLIYKLTGAIPLEMSHDNDRSPCNNTHPRTSWICPNIRLTTECFGKCFSTWWLFWLESNLSVSSGDKSWICTCENKLTYISASLSLHVALAVWELPIDNQSSHVRYGRSQVLLAIHETKRHSRKRGLATEKGIAK